MLYIYDTCDATRCADIKASNPYHKDQLDRIFQVMGFPKSTPLPTTLFSLSSLPLALLSAFLCLCCLLSSLIGACGLVLWQRTA